MKCMIYKMNMFDENVSDKITNLHIRFNSYNATRTKVVANC